MEEISNSTSSWKSKTETRKEAACSSTQRLLHFNPPNKPCYKNFNSRKGENKTEKLTALAAIITQIYHLAIKV